MPQEGYFKDPYLLWFVAENPIRNHRLPENIAAVTQLIIERLKGAGVETLQEQLDYTLGLVCSGCVSRECGLQVPLIDVLVDAGADPNAGVAPALPHRETEALRQLISLGVDLDVFNPPGYHAHSTALHQAAFAGHLEAVQVLIGAGASRRIRDRLFHGTPLEWAEYALGNARDQSDAEALARLEETISWLQSH